MSDDCVKVAVRVRPLVDSEKMKGCQTCINMIPGEPQLQVSGTEKAFTFDYVFGSDVEHELVYNEAVQNMVKNIFGGYNVTILAYGQTGSGKTYSMGTNYTEGEPMGVIPRAVTDIFNTINSRKDWNYRVTVAFIELYQEQVYDLLSGKSRKESVLEIREDPKGIKIAGLTQKEVKNVAETFASLSQGSIGRATGATNMNSQSSRSHAIFTITVYQQKGDDSNSATESKFQLVDLAGSERSKKTGATGDRFKEGVNINKGLLALGNVISLLGEGGSAAYIGYRDSKLTRLLQDSLGGNSKTLMLACVSPADYNLEETLSTLRYADRAKKIKNKPIVNQDPRASEINRLKLLVKDLQLSTLGQGSGILSCPPEHGELSEKNRILQKKLRELSEQLHANLIETMCMHERADLAENAKNRMEEGLHQILEEFQGYLSNEEIDPELRASLQKIYDKILDLQNHQRRTNAEIMQQISTEKLTSFNKSKDESNVGESVDDMDMSVEGIINLHEEQAEHTLRQAERNNEVQNINRALAIKEELVSRLLVNASQIAESKELQEMENEVKTLQSEKEQLLKLLEETQANSASAKLAETRRKKLQELEKKITELNRKCVEQSRIIKAKEKTDQQVKNLSNEILGLKQTRVKLLREMRKESEKFSQWKLVREREVLRLKDQDRKRQNQMARLQSLHNKQQNVFKRKMEEASAINKRLKEAFEKQKRAVMNRKEKTKVKESVKSWVGQELEVLLSTVDAKCSLEKLMKDRAFFANETEALKAEQAKNPSPELEVQINDLNTYVNLRTAQISELQNQIVQSDQENRSNSRLETIQTVGDAKIIVKELFQSITEVQKKFFEKSSDHDELLTKLDAALFEARRSELKRTAQNQATDFHVDHDAIEAIKKENEELKAKNAQLEQELAEKSVQKRKTSFPKKEEIHEYPAEIFDSDMSLNEDDTKNDPDWRKTPIAKRLRQMKMNSTMNINNRASVSTRLALKRSSEGNTTCACTGPCGSKLCLCRKEYVICSDNCGCDPEKCQNKDKENAAKAFFHPEEPKRAKTDKQ